MRGEDPKPIKYSFNPPLETTQQKCEISKKKKIQINLSLYLDKMVFKREDVVENCCMNFVKKKKIRPTSLQVYEVQIHRTNPNYNRVVL